MRRPSPNQSVFPNQVRIIGGKWRRRLLRFPSGADLRPTPDRVRETLFNWLGQELTDLSVLDLFAGSGALSFEALSRGAAHAVAVDADLQAVAAMKENASTLSATGLEPRRADALRFLLSDPRTFDVIFLDPPFREQWMDRLWPQVSAHLNPGGVVYVEQAHAIDPPAGWDLFRHQRAGKVHYHLLRRSVASEAAPDGV